MDSQPLVVWTDPRPYTVELPFELIPATDNRDRSCFFLTDELIGEADRCSVQCTALTVALGKDSRPLFRLVPSVRDLPFFAKPKR